MEINDKTLQALATALNYRALKQEIISSNVANADTPGFKAKELNFEKALARALNIDGKTSMNSSDTRHFDVGSGGFENIAPEIADVPNGIVSEDGNTVDTEAEMAKLAENKILYDALIQLVNKKIGMRKYLLNSER